MSTKTQEFDNYMERLESRLIAEYGYVVAIKELAKILSFKSGNALQQTITRGQISLPLFKMDQRRGVYAMTADVAEWLTVHRFEAIQENKDQMKKEVPTLKN